MKATTRQALRATHKWIGLIGGLWILVLGITGLMLDHRDDWGWAWRASVSKTLLPDHTVETLKNRHITLAQVNPDNADQWIIAGPVGAWRSLNGGSDWQRLDFSGLTQPPMVFALVLDSEAGWDKVWMATDDGLWSFDPVTQKDIKRADFEGIYLTGLDNGADANSLVVVENRSTLMTWSKSSKSMITKIKLNKTTVSELPEKVSWSRFLFDTHLGRSFINRPLNMALNDFGALAMIILVLTGVLQWYFIRRWRKNSQPRTTTKRSILNALYNAHAPIIGILALFPILYLSATGIIFNHRSEWMMPLVMNKVDRKSLPPVYDFKSLEDEISHVVAYPDNSDKFTIGTRLGALTTIDGGTNWVRETNGKSSPGFVWSLKRVGDELFLGGLGSPSFVRKLDTTDWVMVPGLRGMPSDATFSNNEWYMISGPNMFSGVLRSGVSVAPFKLPMLEQTPLMLVMFELHNGGIIAKWFRYVLDLMALALIFMVISGPILWWRRKWA